MTGLADGSATPMDFTGNPLRNFAYVAGSATESDDDLLRWIEKSASFVRAQRLTDRPRRTKKKSVSPH